MTILQKTFNPEKHYLGKLCPKGHDWEGTGKSIRRTCTRACLECEFIYRRRNKRQLTETEKLERQAYGRNYYHQNKDYFLQRVKAYHETEKGAIVAKTAKQRYRARKREALRIPFTVEERTTHFAIFNNECAYCGKHCDRPTLDHFIPISKGGMHALHNLIPACANCNASKKESEAETWFRRQNFFSEKRWARILKALGKNKRNYQQIALL